MSQAEAASVAASVRAPSLSIGVLRLLAGLGLASASGLIANLAFPPYEAWPLIFVAFVPLVVAQHRIMPARLAPLAPGAAIGVFYMGQLSAGLAEGNVPWYIELWPLYVGLLIAALCWPGRRFHERTQYRWLALSFPVAWTAIDAARTFSGVDVLAGTWGNPVYALYGQFQLLQPLSIFGIFGLELLVLCINFALGALAIALMDRLWAPGDHPVANLHRAALVGVVVAALAGGWAALSYALLDERPGQLRVAAVMANAPIDAEEEYQRMIAATRDAAAQGAHVVVWREGGLKFNPLRERADELRRLARETGAHLAVGYSVREEGLRRNEALVIAPDGRIFGPYGKSHPGRFAGDHSDTGGVYKVYDTAIGRIATIICYDLDFTDTAREMARRGAQLIAVPSNDVPAIAATHYTHLVFRAIENRLPMAKADSLFDIAVIDPYGRILDRRVNLYSMAEARAAAEARSRPAEFVIATVPLGGGDTLFVRFGDWPGWLAIGAVGLLALWRLGRTAMRRR